MTFKEIYEKSKGKDTQRVSYFSVREMKNTFVDFSRFVFDRPPESEGDFRETMESDSFLSYMDGLGYTPHSLYDTDDYEMTFAKSHTMSVFFESETGKVLFLSRKGDRRSIRAWSIPREYDENIYYDLYTHRDIKGADGNTYRSIDGGATWRRKGSSMTFDAESVLSYL